MGVFEHPFFCKIDKNEGGTLSRQCHKADITCTKIFWSRAGLEPTSFCLTDLKKALTSMPSASRSSVAQFSVSASQLIKLIKSVSSSVLKKEQKRKVTAIVCVFYEKRRPKSGKTLTVASCSPTNFLTLGNNVLQ